MILSDEYRDHVPRRINTIRKLYAGNFILLLVLIIIEFLRFTYIPGISLVLFIKVFISIALIIYLFTGNKYPVGIHLVGMATAFLLGFQVEVFSPDNSNFNFDIFTLQTGLILMVCLGMLGMNLFYSTLASIWILFIYASTLYSKGTFYYSYFFLAVFIIIGILINGIVNDQYEVEKGMIQLINYWKDYSSQLINDKLPKEYHLQNATCLYIDVTGIFSYFYENQSLRVLKNALLEFYKEFETEKNNFKIHQYDETGHYWFIIFENPANSDSSYADPIADFAIRIRNYFDELCKKNNVSFTLRMGMHSGKFTDYTYDEKNHLLKVFRPLTVFNRAKQMESEGVNGEIQTTHQTYSLLRNHYYLTRRDIISEKTEQDGVYILNGKKEF